MGRNQLTPFLFTSVISSSATWENGNLKKFEWASTFHSKLKNLRMLQQNLKKFTSISSSTFIFCQGSAKCTKGMVIFSVSLYKITLLVIRPSVNMVLLDISFRTRLKPRQKMRLSTYRKRKCSRHSRDWLTPSYVYLEIAVLFLSKRLHPSTNIQPRVNANCISKKKKLKSMVSRGSRRETKSFKISLGGKAKMLSCNRYYIKTKII